MSVSPIYIKSQNDSLDLRRISDYNPYEFAIYPITDQPVPDKTNFPGEYDRAITVNQIDIVNNRGPNGNNVTFNNLLRIYENGTVQRNISNSWNPQVDYFSSSYTGPKVYLNNLYQSIIDDIKNKTVDTVYTMKYMLYGPTGEQRAVTSITRQNGYYRFFVTGIGGTDFNEITGIPLNSVDASNNIISLNYVVYKYDGYSQFTTEMYNTIYSKMSSNIFNSEGAPAGKQFELAKSPLLRGYIDNYNIYITRLRDNDNREQKVEWVWKDYNTVIKLGFFSDFGPDWYEGVSYNGSIYKGIYNWREKSIVYYDTPAGYQIYRRTGGFLNFNKTNSIILSLIDFQNFIPYTISPSISLGLNISPLTFYITNNKPTDRIFVYQTNNNKLLHITDWIAKDTTQNVTINYTNNGVINVSSSVTPVNPLFTPSSSSLTIPKHYNNSITWTKTPKNPITGGLQGNQETYVCRVNKNGYLYIGRYENDTKQCYYHAINIESRGSNDFEFASKNTTLTWKWKNEVSNKIEGGLDQYGRVSYICRVKVNNNGMYNSLGPNIAIGNETIDNDGTLKCLYDYYGGKTSTAYELLTK